MSDATEFRTKLKAVSTGIPTAKLTWEVIFPEGVDPRWPALYNNAFYKVIEDALSELGWEFTKLVEAIMGGDQDVIDEVERALVLKFGLESD